MKYFIQLSYNGTNYHGWQKQPNANTVQQEIEKALFTLLQKEISIAGCGRTDTGVHASDYYLHTVLSAEIDITTLKFKLNNFLPSDIAIKTIVKVAEDSHARFDALERTYNYYIHQEKNPFIVDTSYYYKFDLNIDKMNQACQVLFNYTDFTSFSKLNTDTFTNDCTITKAEWVKEGSKLVFTIAANRFLRNMVRAIVGTLLQVGLEKITVNDFEKIILSKKRSNAGQSVPACGLFLSEVKYPKNIFIE